MRKAVITSTLRDYKFHVNFQVSEAFSEAATRKYVKREFRRRLPDVAEKLQGAFKLEIKR